MMFPRHFLWLDASGKDLKTDEQTVHLTAYDRHERKVTADFTCRFIENFGRESFENNAEQINRLKQFITDHHLEHHWIISEDLRRDWDVLDLTFELVDEENPLAQCDKDDFTSLAKGGLGFQWQAHVNVPSDLSPVQRIAFILRHIECNQEASAAQVWREKDDSVDSGEEEDAEPTVFQTFWRSWCGCCSRR